MKYKIALNGKNYEIEVEKGEAIVLSESELAAFQQTAAPAAPVAAPAPAATAPAATPAPASVSGDGEVIPSPLPGAVIAVKISAGQAVKKGDLLMVIEAMKMENEVFAPRDGTVTQVVAVVGASVSTGDPLFTLR